MKIPTKRQFEMHDHVCKRGENMKVIARVYGVSRTTVQRALDAVTEFNCEKITLDVTGAEAKEIIGWLRNGNFTAGELADRITAQIEGS